MHTLNVVNPVERAGNQDLEYVSLLLHRGLLGNVLVMIKKQWTATRIYAPIIQVMFGKSILTVHHDCLKH